MAQYSNWKQGEAQKIASFDQYTEVYIQCFGAATFFIGSDRQSLETPAAIGGGLQFTQASTTPPFKLTWIGDLWVLANAAGSTIEITPTIKSGGNSLA